MDDDKLDWEVIYGILKDYSMPLQASTITAECLINYGIWCPPDLIGQIISNECDKGNYSLYINSNNGEFECYFDEDYYQLYKQGITGV